MKKSILVISLMLLLCVCFAVSAFAIDTPWLPIKPDGGTTESSSPTNESTDTTDAKKDVETTSNEKNSDMTATDVVPSETEGTTESELSSSDNATSELSTETGCGSTVGACAILMACLAASVVCYQNEKGE